MKKKIMLSLLAFGVLGFLSLPFVSQALSVKSVAHQAGTYLSAATSAVTKITKLMVTKKINLKGYLYDSTGKVNIKDGLKVTGKTTLSKNLSLPSATFSGTDISAIDTTTLTGGELYYNSTDNTMNYWNGSEWKRLTDYTAGAGINFTNDQIAVSYDHVITVAKAGGNYTTITEALNSITDNDSDNRYLVWVAPGTYEEQITTKSYVDIEGAGKHLTIIKYTGGTDATAATVNASVSYSELRNLAVLMQGTSTNGSAIYCNGGSASLSDIKIQANTATDANNGINITNNAAPILKDATIIANGGQNAVGLIINNSLPRLYNSTISVNSGTTNFGIQISTDPVAAADSDPIIIDDTIINVDATNQTIAIAVSNSGGRLKIYNDDFSAKGGSADNFGINNTSGTISVQHSIMKGTEKSIINQGIAYVATTNLTGNVGNSGTIICVNDYNGNFVQLNASCELAT